MIQGTKYHVFCLSDDQKVQNGYKPKESEAGKTIFIK